MLKKLNTLLLSLIQAIFISMLVTSIFMYANPDEVENGLRWYLLGVGIGTIQCYLLNRGALTKGK